MPDLLQAQDGELAHHHQVADVVRLVVGGPGIDDVVLVLVAGPVEQAFQGQQPPGLAGLLLSVDLLEAEDVGPQPLELGPEEGIRSSRVGRSPGRSSRFSTLNEAMRSESAM